MWCSASSCKRVPGHSCQEPPTKQDGAQHWQAIFTLWCSFIFKLLRSLLVSGDVCSTCGGGVNRQSDYCPGDRHAACTPVIAWSQFSGESPLAWASAVMTLTPSKSEHCLLMHEISKQSQFFFNFVKKLAQWTPGRWCSAIVPLLEEGQIFEWRCWRWGQSDKGISGKLLIVTSSTKIKNPDSKTHNPKTRIQNPNPKSESKNP